jgi:hypothetical protein
VRRGEGGFGLLELVVASTVMMSAITSLAYVATNAFSTIGRTRERHTADGLLDEAMEQLRALPYDTISLGLRTSDLAGDPRLIGAGTSASPYRLAATNERIVHVSNNRVVAPIVPNSSTRTVNGVVYTVRMYLTYFNDDTTTGTFTATAYVDWFSGVFRGATFVRTSTVIFSPAAAAAGSASSCLSTATHATAGPCLPFFTATSSVKAGRTSFTTGSTLGAVVDTPSVASVFQIEQVKTVLGLASTEALGLPSGTPSVWGPVAGGSQATDDQAANNPKPYDTMSGSSAPPGSSPTTPFGSGTLSFTVGAATTYDSVSTIRANPAVPAASPYLCRDLAGTALADDLPCGRTTGSSGTMTGTVTVPSQPLGLTTMDVLEIGTTTVGAHTNYDALASGASCTASGCAKTAASRTVSSIKIGSLPGPLKLPGMGFLVELTGYSDSVTAEAGITSAVPTATSAGTLKVWNGVGYTTIPWATAKGTTLPVAAVSASLGAVTINITTDLRAGTTSAQPTTGTCLGSLACTTRSEAVVSSPLTGTITYDIRSGLVSVLSFTMAVNMGDLSATAAYADPPTP